MPKRTPFWKKLEREAVHRAELSERLRPAFLNIPKPADCYRPGRYPVLALSSLQLFVLPSRIRRPFGQDEIWPGSVSRQEQTPAAAKSDLKRYQCRATSSCELC